jgi:hypothetical protein
MAVNFLKRAEKRTKTFFAFYAMQGISTCADGIIECVAIPPLRGEFTMILETMAIKTSACLLT